MQLAVVQADHVRELGHPLASIRVAPSVMQFQHLVQGRRRGLSWIEAGVRILKDDLHLAPALASSCESSATAPSDRRPKR